MAQSRTPRCKQRDDQQKHTEQDDNDDHEHDRSAETGPDPWGIRLGWCRSDKGSNELGTNRHGVEYMK